jgi:uncharacterized membrane protein
MEMVKNWILVLFLLATISVGIAVATPDLVVDVTPTKDTVLPGEIANYDVSVTCMATIPEHVILSITNPRTDWSYTFVPEEFDILPGQTVISDLSIGVPSDAPPGEYYHDIRASGLFWGVEIEQTLYTNLNLTPANLF